MDYRSKFLTAFGLILVLLVGNISYLKESIVEEKGRIESIPDYDICTLYDHSEGINRLLFQKNYKPLVVIIADEFIDGINRVRNITQSKRILHDDLIKNDPSLFEFHQIISEHFYLYEAKNLYYFVYPINILDNIFTIYCQKMLLKNQLGVMFDFVNVKDEYPFFEDVLIPLNSSCTNCTLEEYVKRKLQTGESFSELIKLREQLFRGEKRHLTIKAFDNDELCDSIGFNFNSQSYNFLTYFNSLLQQIQNNVNNTLTTGNNISKRTSTVKRSLTCFQSRNLEVTADVFYGNSNVKRYQHPFIEISYLNWLQNTISSLTSNDTFFGNICQDEHKIDIFKLFCFIKDVSGDTTFQITAWIDTLKQLVTKSLITQIEWFGTLKELYYQENVWKRDDVSVTLDYLHKEMLKVNENWRSVMKTAYNFVANYVSEKSNMYHRSILSSPCTIFNYWNTIDNLFPKIEYKRLVIIVADDMQARVLKLNFRRNRLRLKVKRESLHYTKQFVYDEIMKHIYLYQSINTYYYVYPMSTDRYQDALITYLENKMINDYSKVVFYFVNSSNYFSLGEFTNNGLNDVVIPALPDNCNLIIKNCTVRFLNPMYLINLHQEFHKRFSKYFPVYATFYNDLTNFTNNNLHYTGNSYIEYSKEFYYFLQEKPISLKTNYLFKDLPCESSRKLDKRIDIDFSMTNMTDFLLLYKLLLSAQKNIISTNITDNSNEKYLCRRLKIFKFIKPFCFLRTNYIKGLLKVINSKSTFIGNTKIIVETEKKLIIEYLNNTLKWMDTIFGWDYFDFENDGTKLLIKSQTLYSKLPNIFFNNEDLSDKIYLARRQSAIFYECNKKF